MLLKTAKKEEIEAAYQVKLEEIRQKEEREKEKAREEELRKATQNRMQTPAKFNVITAVRFSQHQFSAVLNVASLLTNNNFQLRFCYEKAHESLS